MAVAMEQNKPTAPTESSLDAPSRRPSVIRAILLALGIISILLIAWGVYYRDQTDERLSAARRELPSNPQQAFAHFRPINGYSNLLTLGRVRRAQQQFVRDLRDNIIRTFNFNPVPNSAHFQQAQQTASVIREMQRFDPENAQAILQQLVVVAREAVPRVRDQGTLSALQNAMLLFDYLRAQGVFTPANMPDYPAWREAMFQVDQGPLALRDTLETANLQFGLALQSLGISVSNDPQWPLAALPPSVSDDQLITTVIGVLQALRLIDLHVRNYPDQITNELLSFQARLHYNLAVLKLQHALDRGATLPRLGSDFMAFLMINPDLPGLPEVGRMYEMFLHSISMHLQLAEQDFANPQIEPDPLRSALLRTAAYRGLLGLATLQEKAAPAPPAAAQLNLLNPAQRKQLLEDSGLMLITKLR